LSCFATDKRGHKSVFAGRAMLGNFLGREFTGVFNEIRAEIFT
jgi:hypothetical protein